MVAWICDPAVSVMVTVAESALLVARRAEISDHAGALALADVRREGQRGGGGLGLGGAGGGQADGGQRAARQGGG
ncbi:hypothetical protein [Catenulispora subtropica]|uniref:Uncharacterized protein n=1 Tax=Catenulispora subtropica TaxID=450798 RepID=A0ABN2RDU4_9ACTN